MSDSEKKKKKKLEDELKELFYRAEWSFEEAQNYLAAAYLCTLDLQKYEDSEEIRSVLRILREVQKTSTRQMNTNLESLKTLLRDVLGVEVGVEKYESESED